MWSLRCTLWIGDCSDNLAQVILHLKIENYFKLVIRIYFDNIYLE